MRRDADRGESLLELLVALAIMGVAVVAVMGGLGASVTMSDVHRKQATAGAYVRAYAETLESSMAGGGYVGCASTTTYPVPTLTNYSASVVSVRYWTGSAWAASCTTDLGVQQVTVEVHSSDNRAREQLVVVLRKPCRLTEALCS
jgi:prepilin-type N-terminal cleavage/methylation domain-containing protein